MILTCPSCTMRYLVSEGAIGPEGRKVRCAHCGHQWFQEGEDGLDEALFDSPSSASGHASAVEAEAALAALRERLEENAPAQENSRAAKPDEALDQEAQQDAAAKRAGRDDSAAFADILKKEMGGGAGAGSDTSSHAGPDMGADAPGAPDAIGFADIPQGVRPLPPENDQALGGELGKKRGFAMTLPGFLKRFASFGAVARLAPPSSETAPPTAQDAVQEITQETVPATAPETVEAAAQENAAPAAPAQGRRMGFVAAGALFAVVMVVLLLAHPFISRVWPSSNMFYAAMGMNPVLPGQGLVLEELEARFFNDTIALSGSIINLRVEAVDVPAILATITGEGPELPRQILIRAPVEKLEGESEAVFNIVYPEVPEGAQSVNFAFSFLKPVKEMQVIGLEAPLAGEAGNVPAAQADGPGENGREDGESAID